MECVSSKTPITCSDGECTQVIILPAISVWAVSTMPNGDIVAGTSDGVIRVFSEEEKRWTDLQALKVWLFSISSSIEGSNTKWSRNMMIPFLNRHFPRK